MTSPLRLFLPLVFLLCAPAAFSGRAAAPDPNAAAISTNVSGAWTVVFKGQTGTTMTLERSGNQVSGNLVTTDGTAGYVTGQLVNSTLTLSRNTGLDTIQYYQVTIQGDSFPGTFRNEGRYADSGTFAGTRR